MERKKIPNRLLAILLLVVLLIGIIPATAFAMRTSVKLQVDTGYNYISLEVEPTDRVEDVKQKIFDQEGIMPEQQILTFNGVELADGNTLQDYSVQEDSEFQLTLKDLNPPDDTTEDRVPSASQETITSVSHPDEKGEELADGNTPQDYSVQKDSESQLTTPEEPSASEFDTAEEHISSVSQETITSVSYLDEKGVEQTLVESYITIDSSNVPTEWTSGWYVVDGEVSVASRVTVNGSVKLILSNGANLAATKGIDVSASNSLTIYAQSTGESAGKLQANGEDKSAGIGSGESSNGGNITINGGAVAANGGIYAAGIGGGFYSSGGTITINGGTVTANGNVYAAGIGGGEAGNGGNITINSGTVTANGGSGGAGIGGGFSSFGGMITINGGTVTANGGSYAAGIGGGIHGSSGTITINGGAVVADGGSYAAGIGGGDGGNGDNITINGSTITATGGDRGAGIGGGNSGSSGTITISGGTVAATGGVYAAGIGSGESGNGGNITINSGTVTANGGEHPVGIGNGKNGTNVSFSTGEDGTAVIFSSSISDQSQKTAWSGLIFDGNDGKIYGQSYTIANALTIPADKTLTVEDGKTLTNGSTITNNGTIKVNMGGNYSGDQPENNKVIYQIDWDTDGDGTADDTTYVAYGSAPSHDPGSKAGDAQYSYTFTGWSPDLAPVSEPTTYKALFAQSVNHYNVTLPTGEGYTVTTGQSTTVEYGGSFTFTITIEDGYSTTEAFEVKANGTPLAAQTDGSYQVTVTGNTEITVNGVADITAPSNISVSYGADSFKEFLNTITFGLFFKNTVTVTISATDAGSGVKEISYRLGADGVLQTVPAVNGKITFTIQPEFKGNIQNVIATDNAGNTSEGINYEYFAVEQTVPTEVTVNTNGYESGTWINGDVTLTVSGSTVTSGIAKYQYSMDGGQYWYDMTATKKTEATATEPLNVTEAQVIVSNNGTANYIFRAVSNAGNESASSAPVTVKIDKVQPTIAVEGNTTSYLTSDTITITANAGESGVTKVEIQAGDSWTDITDSYLNGYTVTANSTYTFRVTNGVGVTATADITYDKIDSVQPVVAIGSGSYVPNTWSKESVTLSVSNTAANLGTTTFQYKVDNGDWQTYTNDITVSEETAGTVYTFNAISASGVESDEVSIAVKLDKTAPDGDIKIQENSIKKLLNQITFGLFFNENVDVTIIGTDDLSGVASIQFHRSQDILTQDEVDAISDWQDYTSISETAVDAERFIYYARITDEAGNTTVIGSDGVTFDLTAPVIEGIVDGSTYYTTQSVTISEANLQSVTLNGDTVGETFALPGNTDMVYTIVATDKVGNKTTFTVTMKPIENLTAPIAALTLDNVTSADKNAVEAVKEQVESLDMENATEDEMAAKDTILENCNALLGKIDEIARTMADLELALQGYDVATVTSSDKEAIQQLKDSLQNLINSSNLTQEEKARMQEMAAQCDPLLDMIAAASSAANTENIHKVEGITSDNVSLEDKEDLTAAKEDVENALENFGGNYTEEEKAELEEKLEQINNALESIEKVEAVQDVIAALPDTVEPDDADAEAWINAAKEQYDQLTEHEKSLILEALKAKLESLLGDVVDYQILVGNNIQWTVGNGASVTITVNGSVEKFVGIQIDGKEVDVSNYTVKSGSTIITLKPEYLNTLSVGQHTLTVTYIDGQVSCEFEVLKRAASTTPETGDNNNVVFWTTLLLLAACALTGTTAYTYKKKYCK